MEVRYGKGGINDDEFERNVPALRSGSKGFEKGIFACTLTNLSLMLSVVVTVQIFLEVLKPLTGGAVSWSKMWMLFGAGVVAVRY